MRTQAAGGCETPLRLAVQRCAGVRLRAGCTEEERRLVAWAQVVYCKQAFRIAYARVATRPAAACFSNDHTLQLGFKYEHTAATIDAHRQRRPLGARGIRTDLAGGEAHVVLANFKPLHLLLQKTSGFQVATGRTFSGFMMEMSRRGG